MKGDPAKRGESPVLQDILDALDDPDCRSILNETDEPMTATELTDICDIPTSTVYRKLNLLRRASLVRELHEVGPEGGRISRYQRNMTDVTFSIDDGDEFSVVVERPPRGADERLADMWSKMGDEL